MKKRSLAFIKYIFFLGLGIFLVWWSLHQIPAEKWDEFKVALRNTRYRLIIPVFLILLLSHFLRALRWKILIQPMGYRPKTLNSFFAVMIGYFANLAVPRLGEVLKCTILARYEKIPAEKLVGTIVAERVFDVICLGIVFILALLLQYDVALSSYASIKNIQAVPAAGTQNSLPWIIGISIGIVFIGIISWLIYAKRRHIFIRKIKTLLAGVWEGLLTTSKLQQKSTFILYSIAIWALYIIGTWIGFQATAGTAHLGIAQAVSCLAFASIGMIITPGGVGAYAYLLAIVLEQNKIDYAIGVANGTLQWFSQVIIVIVAGAISLLLLPVYNKKKQHESN